MKLSLRNRFLIPTVILVVIGMGLSASVSYVKSKSAMTEEITQRIEYLTSSTREFMGLWVRDRKLDIKSWSEESIFKTALQDYPEGKAALQSAGRQLAGLMEDYKYYEDIALADKEGNVIAASGLEAVGKVRIGDRPYFKEAVSGKRSCSDVITSRKTGNPIFVLASPVSDKDQVVGVLFSVVDVNKFSTMFIDGIHIGGTGYAYVLDARGRVISHPDKTLIMQDKSDLDFIKNILAEKNGLGHYTYEGTDKITGFQTYEEMGWTVCVAANTGDLMAPIVGLRNANLIISFIVTVLAVVVILLVVRSAVKPINRTLDGLTSAADQVSMGSMQVSDSSQELAEGSSKQAASVEETSSSLEEMSSMTKRNADYANEARSMMGETRRLVENVDKQMTEMVRAMVEITRSSEETGKIIKTIDEIAFQTNLLALNAAVEAARAGEAGAGFAVVANEVRNLAMRAAEEARSTADLLENTIKSVKNGNELTVSTQEAFKENMEISIKVGKLVDEIAAASNEQAQGIEQINTAVAEIDSVVQSVAATAEESASAAEEMTSQAEQMKAMVKDLAKLAGGGMSKMKRTGSKATRGSGAGKAIEMDSMEMVPSKT